MAERERQKLGKYTLAKLPLGQGGFARVYLGEYAGTKVALKLLDRTVEGDEVAVFQREARILARLQHPNIVRVRDFDVEAGTHKPFLVMDYAPNGSLRERHPRGTRLPLLSIVAFVMQVADALQFAHEQGIMHLDVKPENLLLGQHDELLLSDFGSARLSQQVNTSEHSAYYAAGTAEYMAPEQIQGKPCPASDQYALAILVYEWLAGQPPFRGSDASIRRQHIHDPVPPLREQLLISPAVERVVLKALAKTPEKRFDSIREFASALEAASTISSPPEQREPVRPRRISRRAVLSGTGGVVGLALLGAGIWWEMEMKKTSPPPQGTLYVTYRGHTGDVYSVAWSPNGKRIASGGADGTVQVWDAANGGNVLTFLGHANSQYGVGTVAWSPDGKRIASSADGVVQVWDAANGGNIIPHSGGGGASWSPDGKRIASAGANGTVQVWDAANGGNVFTFHGDSNYMETVAWSPNGKRIASASDAGTVQVWDAANGGNVYTYRGHANVVFAVAWSPNSQRIASASADRSVQVWDAANGGNSFTQRGYTNDVDAVAWSPDGRLIVSGSLDHTAQVWDAANGGHIFIYRRHSNFVTAVAWSPDSQRIASASDDGTVQVWQGA